MSAPTALGRTVLLYFAILLVILVLANFYARKKGLHRFFAALGAAWVVIIDRYVKLLVMQHLDLGGAAPLLPGLLRLERVHNYGAAWSSFSGARWLLVGVTTLGLVALFWFVTHAVKHPLGVWSIWLAIGGGIGNLIDRVQLGYVVDMLATEFINFPVFNVADIFVTCGAFAGAVYYLRYYEKYDAKQTEKGQAHGTDHPDGPTK